MGKEFYKLYQLMGYLVMKFSYKSIVINGLNKNDEIFLINTENKTYQLMRISTSTLDETFYDVERINKCISALSKGKEFKFLDVHIGNETPGNEQFDTVCMNSGFYAGEDLEYAFPGLKNVIHEVENPTEEINKIIFELNLNTKNTKKFNRIKSIPFDTTFLATNIIIFLCILNFVVMNIISFMGFSKEASAIIVGADYKMFTYGLYQLYRLFTCAFVHGSLLHLICNMFSLFIIGRFIEFSEGKLKYLCILYLSIIAGSLTHGILTFNSLELGISGGIYGLLGYYVMMTFKNNGRLSPQMVNMIMLNVMINFIGNVAWQAHLGGFIAGILLYFIYNSETRHTYIALILGVFIFLGVRYIQNDKITPIYGKTDFEVVEFYDKIGLDKLSENTAYSLIKAYDKQVGE